MIKKKLLTGVTYKIKSQLLYLNFICISYSKWLNYKNSVYYKHRFIREYYKNNNEIIKIVAVLKI